jgi:hypothetical protein
MTDIAIIAAGIFVMGVVAGVVAFVSVGIHREEKRFREWRRYREAQGTWTGPNGSEHYFTEEAFGRTSNGARALTGLYVRRRHKDAERAPVLWHDRQVR